MKLDEKLDQSLDEQISSLDEQTLPEEEVNFKEENLSTGNLVEDSSNVVKNESNKLEGFQVIGDDFTESNSKKVNLFPFFLNYFYKILSEYSLNFC